MTKTYKTGRLSWNPKNERYGLKVGDSWEHPGFCCGECMEVFVDGEWITTRMEMMWPARYYLVNTPYEENLDNVSARIKTW